MLTICGSLEYLEGIKKELIKYKLIKKDAGSFKKPSKIHTFCLGGNLQCKKVSEFLYKDESIYLERKFKKLLLGEILDGEKKAIIKENKKITEGDNPNAKEYEIISPDGEKFLVFGALKHFCKDHGLCYNRILDVRFKRKDEFKGWKCRIMR